MSDPILVFVNESPVRVGAGVTALEAVIALDPDLAARLGSGGGYLTDGRGIRLAPESPVFPGAILRVVVSARQPRDEADAHP
jgi:hypothetical protein